MDLKSYLTAKDETVARFARRSGVLPETLARVRDRKGCRIDTAQAIVRASEAEPTQDGGTITYDELVPPDEADDGLEMRSA